ncbi:MAG: phospholipase D-like domain-containing protein [Caldilinea sp.]|nr:phosphatidylserine/phosphatidylglycerophosphate/cardiolipin synthase family protein [Caldilineaceae bacterium]MCO5208818.1 phospholipase D-like domain-containing protein [Caldilinea sp.]HRW46096.1 phospholipase D family protein [Caldilinea sp.]
MQFAEQFATPVDGQLGTPFAKRNDFKELFYLRWGKIRFDVRWGSELNIKVLLKVYRSDGIVEHFMVDTEPRNATWKSHRRSTRDFYVHPFPANCGRVTCVKFAYIVHLDERSIPSQHEYIFFDGHHFDGDQYQRRAISSEHATPNGWRTHEVDAATLQRDVQWIDGDFGSLHAIPKFTKGLPGHPYHPKRYIHDQIDETIRHKQRVPDQLVTIKVCVDCIDDTDFVNHLLHAAANGVWVQVQVDWRKMTLTHSDNYLRLKRSGVELLGVFCTPKHPLIEVAPDMHNKFIVFRGSDAILGSFNITFDRWGANWESGMTFSSQGMARLLDNIFQSIRGGVIQKYQVDPLSRFNLLYTFGRHALPNGKYYRPNHAILSEIHRARHSIRLCLFLLGELQGEHGDSVIDALIQARARGVDVQAILNGHLARQGDPGREYTMEEELRRPLLPAVYRLQQAGIPLLLAYGRYDQPVPYCPIHSKYCVIDERIVLEGSFNWYNTSVYSHDLYVVVNDPVIARIYLNEYEQTQRDFRIF